MLSRLFLFFVFLLPISLAAQEEKLLKSLFIPSELSTESNAVVRWDETTIDVKAYNKMLYTNKRIVTILNSSGKNRHGAVMYYDQNTNIKKMEVKIYDAFGKEIKKIRKNDFEDVSAVSGVTLYSDNRVKYLNYTPTAYPYTVLFETEVEKSSTAFLNGWQPIEGYYISTENADYKLINSSGIPIRIKTSNFEDYGIEKLGDFQYSARNLKSIKPEVYSPDFSKFTPILKASLTEFDMEGVKGSNNDWSDFGKWMNDKLIKGTEVLPEKVKSEIKALTSNATTDLEKAKIVYQYMQSKTRYISVQIGIGGWKPMLAGDVDRLGYGDCKGLSNYTKALLDEVGVNSYYAIIYGDRDIRDIDSSFSSVQGNHAVLCIPTESDYVWLECTSQTTPFGYTANFTDDRDALIITPEGGKIVHTTSYKTENNVLHTKAQVKLSEAGGMQAQVLIKSYGSRFGYRYQIPNMSQKDQKLNYKDQWGYINSLDVGDLEFESNKNDIIFTEKVNVSSDLYASRAGNRLLIQPNFFNRRESAPQRYPNRNIPFEIERGVTDIDSYEITIPHSLEIETLIEDVEIKNNFGEYSVSIFKSEDNKLIYNRKFVINKGAYKKEEYESFRRFLLEVLKHDKSKIVLKSKT
ncbi:DUF3857 domain-containing protein [Subsaxibacter sp. CAU 1640]|uniref:DUF3857 domain-containing protein n=1 Tax=Subsaxibacter sp. CAU 1640 TaxID=2933271 RepID=UPI0020066B7F|nr:DUF3857 domain-containing protein [Subsaxibacter sp. CAU 1640]MCK7590320.1 DUF3857 domain-containing protein [Subsaxibacter sp. CAU 1640]